MTIRDAYLLGRERLRSVGAPEEAIEAEMLLRFILGVGRAQLYTRWDTVMPPGAWHRYHAVLEERSRGRPVHYIVGEREFMGLRFAVDERVMIPRPETELLVEHLAAWVHTHGGAVLVDVGTGSGCVAISLAQRLATAVIFGTDISAGALEVARANAATHGVANRVRFLQGDLLSPLPADLSGRVDAIASNPPYVSPAQAAALPREIRGFEPEVALLADRGGTAVHRRLIEAAPRWLRPGGVLAMEVGGGQAASVAAAARRAGRFGGVTVLRDGAGIERVVSAPRRAEGEPGSGRN